MHPLRDKLLVQCIIFLTIAATYFCENNLQRVEQHQPWAEFARHWKARQPRWADSQWQLSSGSDVRLPLILHDEYRHNCDTNRVCSPGRQTPNFMMPKADCG